MDRINKINQKLNSIIQNNIPTETNISDNQEIQNRLTSLDQKNYKAQEEINKEFDKLKSDLSNLMRDIEDDRQQYNLFYHERQQFLKDLENRLIQKVIDEQTERENMEQRLLNQIDANANSLKTELKKENINAKENIKSFNDLIGSELSKVVNELKGEQEQRKFEDLNLSKMIDDSFTELYAVINNEKLNRENTENSLIEMIKSIMNRISVEIQNEKNTRDTNEKYLIGLLQETCQKFDDDI